MNISNAFPFTLLVQLAGGLVFLWIFYRLIVIHAAERSFLRRTLWKLVLAGFCVVAFWAVNSLMLQLEARADERFAQALEAFNQARDQIEIVGIEEEAYNRYSYGTDGKMLYILVRDRSTKEVAPCYIKRDKVYVFMNDSVSEPFILFNSVENTIDLYFPKNAVEVVFEKIKPGGSELAEPESEVLQQFLAGLDALEE